MGSPVHQVWPSPTSVKAVTQKPQPEMDHKGAIKYEKHPVLALFHHFRPKKCIMCIIICIFLLFSGNENCLKVNK